MNIEQRVIELEAAITANDAEMNRITDAARRVLDAFQVGIFVRNTEHDCESDWAIKAFPHLKALADLAASIGYKL